MTVRKPWCSSTSWRSHGWGCGNGKREFQNTSSAYDMSGSHRGPNPSSCPPHRSLQGLLFQLVFLTWYSRLPWAGPELPGPSHLTAHPEPTRNSHTSWPLLPLLSSSSIEMYLAAHTSVRKAPVIPN